MDHERVMKRGFARLEFHQNRPKRFFLLVGQDLENGVHIVRQSGDREQIPRMASGNILDAAVIRRGIVQPDPAREVGQGFRTGPVRIILMPRHHPAMPRRFAEKLIVPEPNRARKELGRRNRERRIPERVMKPRPNPPGAKGMKQYVVRVPGFVRMVFVPQFAPFVARIEKFLQFRPQRLDLGIRQQPHPGHIALFAKKGDLFVCQAVRFRIHAGKQVAYSRMQAREVVGRSGHIHCWRCFRGWCWGDCQECTDSLALKFKMYAQKFEIAAKAYKISVLTRRKK